VTLHSLILDVTVKIIDIYIHHEMLETKKIQSKHEEKQQ